MKQIKKLLLIIIVSTLIACNTNNQKTSDLETETKDSTQSVSLDSSCIDEESGYLKNMTNPTVDSVYKLLENMDDFDDYYLNENTSVLFFVAGHVFSEKESNALIISHPDISTYKVEIFSLENKEWNKKDELNVSSGVASLQINIEDYNFDGFKDIYIQRSCSNGYVISYGHLLTIDKDTKKITQHKETSNLGSMKPDVELKSVISEEIAWCETEDVKDVCKLYHKWINNKLIFEKKECPCEGEYDEEPSYEYAFSEEDTTLYYAGDMLIHKGMIEGKFYEVQAGDYLHIILLDSINKLHGFWALRETYDFVDSIWSYEDELRMKDIRLTWERDRVLIPESGGEMVLYKATKIEFLDK